ncbi:MAG: hypothetical protein MPJ52_06125, partial [Alphaproteobacteria bacterium]|nr:hypothetical protein [Alphaproteobacteria bacterium]
MASIAYCGGVGGFIFGGSGGVVECGLTLATCAEGIEMTGEVLRIDYVELVADDFAAARRFYSEVFGWEFKVWGDDYVEILNAGLGGGFRRGDRPVSDGTVVIIYADDIDAV